MKLSDIPKIRHATSDLLSWLVVGLILLFVWCLAIFSFGVTLFSFAVAAVFSGLLFYAMFDKTQVLTDPGVAGTWVLKWHELQVRIPGEAFVYLSRRWGSDGYVEEWVEDRVQDLVAKEMRRLPSPEECDREFDEIEGLSKEVPPQ